MKYTVSTLLLSILANSQVYASDADVRYKVLLGRLVIDRNTPEKEIFKACPQVLLLRTTSSIRHIPIDILKQFGRLDDTLPNFQREDPNLNTTNQIPLTGAIDRYSTFTLDQHEELKLSFDGLVTMLERVKKGEKPGCPSTMHAKKDQERYNNVLTMARYLGVKDQEVIAALEKLAKN